MSTVDKVFSALDQEAISLLGKLDGEDRDRDGNLIPSVSISDQVKAFEAVVAYAALRAKVEPPKKLEASRFDTLKQQFHGTDGGTPARGRASGKAPPAGSNT